MMPAAGAVGAAGATGRQAQHGWPLGWCWAASHLMGTRRERPGIWLVFAGRFLVLLCAGQFPVTGR